ncbi:MAG: PQQ-binding-like beta-propeller repeat protein, partial [Acidimicrobiia bacterium]|nr:PQQ-binding-like beta-propeller repeat protein [Acidimicrobiia bacterium]
VAAGGVAVAYAAEKGRLSLVGVDASSGRQLWVRPATPSEAASGMPTTPMVLATGSREVVAYFRPVHRGARRARLVVADPSTGDDITSSAASLFVEPPEVCGDGHDVCADTVDGVRSGRVRIDPDARRVIDAKEPGLEGLRGLAADGLSDLRMDGVRYFARLDDGKVRWRTSVGDAFGEAWSTDGGWSLDHYPEQGLFVGSIGRNPFGQPNLVDLSDDEVVALDDTSGRVAWSNEGAGEACLSNLALPTAARATPSRPRLPLRCRMSGTSTTGPSPRVFDLDVTLERFDVSTGRTIWSVDLGGAEGLVGIGELGAVVDDHEIAVPTKGRVEVVDLTDGSVRPLGAHEEVGCQSEAVRFTFAATSGASGASDRHLGGVLARACDQHLHRTSQDLGATVAAAMGARIGSTSVVAEPGQLVGYRAG